MPRTKLTKPKKQIFKAKYNYADIRDYIEKKYKIQTRGYKPKIEGYRDFWHFLLDCNGNNVSNGSFIALPDDWNEKDKDGKYYYEWWIREIMELFVKEFFTDPYETMQVWVDW